MQEINQSGWLPKNEMFYIEIKNVEQIETNDMGIQVNPTILHHMVERIK